MSGLTHNPKEKFFLVRFLIAKLILIVSSILKATSPKARGKYANSWAVKKVNGKFIIYNKKPGLTHLLENGHDVVVNGVKVGRASAHPHIKDVNDWVSKTVVERLEQLL